MRQPSAIDKPARPTWPSRRTLGWLAGIVLVLHLAVLASLSGTLDWQLDKPEATRVSPLQTRMITPPAPVTATRTAPPKAAPRTRVATAPAPAHTRPQPAPVETAASAPDTPAPAPTEVAVALPEETTPPPIAPLSDAAPAAQANETAPEPSAQASEAAPATTVTTASESLPLIPLGALPPSMLLSYRLSGQEKGLNYYANGELRWQHNASDYAMSLSVKAFLVGTRHWRSQGAITAGGLAPLRFSDTWRSERAAHFDRANQRVVFSSNAPVAELQPGAQDQISLYVQLAAAMAGEPQRFAPGTRLQIQTATVRDALPWLLTMEASETLTVGDNELRAAKWVCNPRNRFDAKVEFWVTEKYGWLPVRIRITQISGSFIDLLLTGQEPLAPLTTAPGATEKATPP